MNELDQALSLKAGAATLDISPSGAVPLYGYPHVARVSTGIHDPILCSALYLDNGARAVVLIALDILFLDPTTARSVRGAVARRLALPEERVFISCTHTHSAPVTNHLLAWHDDAAVPPPNPDYLDWISAQTVAAAAQAALQAEPAELAWCVADARGVGGNRLDPAGPIDPEAGVLAVRARGGGPMLAMTTIYGMHPTVLHEDSTLVSSDFPHFARQELRERFGSSLTVVYHNGACGNQSPRFCVRGATFAEAERLGRMLGCAVNTSVEKLTAKDFRADVPLGGELREVELPRRLLPASDEAGRQLDRYRAEYQALKAAQGKSAPVRTAECAVFGAEGTVTLARLEAAGEIGRRLAAARPIEVQALRIGDACVAGLPGEIFTEYALRLKRRAPGRVFVVTLVNGELQGYIVTPEAAAHGCYEAMTAVFSPASGEILVEAALELVGSLASPLSDRAGGLL